MSIKSPIRQFIMASLFFLIGGLLLGIVMLDQLSKGISTYKLIWPHVHMLLVGFMLSMIYGVGYQLIPAFLGGRLVNKSLPFIHLILHILGVIIMIVGVFLARSNETEGIYYNISSFGGLMVISGGIIFVYSIATIKYPESFLQIVK